MRLIYARLRRLVGGAARLLAVAALIAAGQSLLLAPIALLVRRMFDTWIPRHDTGAIVLGSCAMLVLFMASALLGYASRRLAVREVKNAVARLRHDLMAQMYALPRAWHDRHDAGRLHAVIVNDTERVDHVLTILAGTVVPALLVTVALCVVGVILNPLLFALFALAAPALVLAAKLLGGRTRRRSRLWHSSLIELSAETMTALRTLPLANVAGAETWELDRQDRRIREVTDLSRRLNQSRATYGIVQSLVGSAAGVLVLAVGGIAIAHGSLSVGELLSFYAVGALLIRQLSIVGPGVSEAVVALESLERLDDLRCARAPQPYEGRGRIEFKGSFEFRGVSFGYDGAPTLQSVDLSVGPGEHVALLGPNGAGKSTLVSLLLGLYRPDAGTVLVDEMPLDEVDLAHLRSQTGVVLQDTVLFPGSILDNIAYGRPGASRDEVIAAARAATAAPLIEALPQAYETEVGREGALLSGGEGQRVALARALLGHPALLVLDEPTTYLDDRAVASLMENLDRLPSSPTILTVTHDPDVGMRADRVVELRDGCVRAEPASALVDR
ncbi:MAG: ABC transporter ATP-binding protein [Actinobacteria bacterium]|nr:ABC transporter ATP-binding protein [Actinomycetota bacterium]